MCAPKKVQRPKMERDDCCQRSIETPGAPPESFRLLHLRSVIKHESGATAAKHSHPCVATSLQLKWNISFKRLNGLKLDWNVTSMIRSFRGFRVKGEHANISIHGVQSISVQVVPFWPIACNRKQHIIELPKHNEDGMDTKGYKHFGHARNRKVWLLGEGN